MYPDAKCSLDFTNPLELVVATILSAQCTDARVNIVTKTLFKKYRRARRLRRRRSGGAGARHPVHRLLPQQAKSLIAMGAALVERHNGEVPAPWRS
jgi:endonuclease-3